MIPAMANVHSHAFQRDLRGVGERSERRGRRLLELARGHVRARRAARPGGHARRRRPRVPRDGGGRATAPSASSTTSITAPTARRTRSRTRWRSRWPARLRRPASRSCCSPPPTHAAAIRASATGRSTTTSRAWTAALARHSRSASPPTASAPSPPTGCARSPPTPTPTTSSATSTRTSSRASSTSAGPSTAARRSSCCTARSFLSDRTTVVHGIHVDDRDVALLAETGTHRRHLPDHRGQPRRRALPGAAVPRRRRADRHRQRQQRGRRPVRGGPRAGDRRPPRGPHPPRPARRGRRPVARRGPRRARVARHRGRRRGHGRPRPPAPARGARRRRHARARHLRVGGYRRAGAPPDLLRLDVRGADRATRAPWSTATGCTSPAPPASTTRR